MEHPAAKVLQRSSEAVVISRLDDGLVIDVNEAFLAASGYGRDDLGRRTHDELVIWIPPDWRETVTSELRERRSVGNVPVGLRTRSRGLRMGTMSALVIEVAGEHDVVWTIRDCRDPTPAERRLACRHELDRVQAEGAAGATLAARALQVLGECLGWELSTLWQVDPNLDLLRCVTAWRSPLANLQQLDENTESTMLAPTVGLSGRVWATGKAIWIPDVLHEPGLRHGRTTAEQVVHGAFAFPVLSDRALVGVVELLSREVREPDPELLGMAAELGRQFGRILRTVREEGAAGNGDAATRPSPSPPGVEDRLAEAGSEGLLRELTANLARLNHLLESMLHHNGQGPSGAEPPAPGLLPPAAAGPQPRLRAGLTLKAVSQRTGIPAATLRTWERRYGFIHPNRSVKGYRLFGEEDVARVLAVKRLLGEGARISAAVAAVTGTAGGTAPPAPDERLS